MKQFLLLSFFCLLAFGSSANTTSIGNSDGDNSWTPAFWESLESSTSAVAANVTFCVDLACFAVTDAVAVAFGYQGFAPTNSLSDPDGDRVYCGTFNVPNGVQEFKYFFAQGQFENLAGAGGCVNGNNNRTITVVEGVPQTVTYGWASCESSCPAPTTTDITFCVDLACFAVSDAVAVAGSFNGFNPGANFLNNTGNRVYCGTVAVPAGPQEFKFFFAQGQFENLAGAGDCVNGNNNRTITVVEGVPQTVTYGWESCEDFCPVPPTADITFCVDLSCFAATDAVAVVGSFNGFNPGANFLNNTGNRVYCGTVTVPTGPQQFRFFFAQQQFENLNPEDPCVTDGNRTITVVEGVPQTVTYGWKSCDQTCTPPPSADVTFCVNLNCSGLNPSNVNIFGAFNGWNPGANSMSDPDGDGIYCTTITFSPGNQEYKFLANGVDEQFQVGDPCTVSCCGGQFTNRVISVVDGVNQTVNFDWESCDATCPPAPWVQVLDGIGCPDGSGSGFDLNTGIFTLESQGCYSTNFTADGAAYIKYDLCGDGEIIAHVGSISGLGWAGISMRESEAPGSKKVSLATNLGSLGRREVRTMTNGYAIPQQFFRPGATWLRLVRSGNQFIGYMSTNGINWQLVMAANVSMSSCIQFGLYVTNYNGSTVTGTFDNVMVYGFGDLRPDLPGIGSIEATANQFATNDFSVLPNPATNEVYLDLKDYYGLEAQVDLLNTVGNTIQTRQIREVGSNLERIDLQGLSSGIYFIRVRTTQGEISKRFLIVD